MCTPADSAALVAEVRNVHGSPALILNGKPTVPMIFYGSIRNGGAKPVEIDTDWKEFGFTFTAPEDNVGSFGVHIRLGGDGPGTVWIDDARVVEGDGSNGSHKNMLKYGDWEGAKDEMSRAWCLFTNKEGYGSDADWDVVTDTVASGKQACRVTIRSGGSSTMHCHLYQTGMTCRAGTRYTYTVKLKSDRKRKGDIQALHHGPPWTIYPSNDQQSVFDSQVHRAARAGIHIHSFGISMPWPKPGEKPSFAGVEKTFRRVLRADPRGLLLPRFGMSAPQWWQEQHPDQCLLFDDGKTKGECPASALWRREALQRLRELVRFCEEHFGGYLVGYHPCGQHTGEWFYQRSWEPRLSGFSPAMTAGFRQWLRQRYPDDEALRAAWNDGAVTHETAGVPSADERRTAAHGLFRDPVKERQLLDFYEYKQVAMEEPLEDMARIIKEETGGKKIVTLFYGYFFDMCGLPSGPQISGHMAMERMLKSPYVDILCSPISYFDRQSGGAGLFMTAVDSVRAAGKLWLNEDDTRTYLAPENAGFGRVSTPQQTFWVHQRNYGHILPRRMACWYMDLGGTGWLDGDDIWENIAQLRQHYVSSIVSPTSFDPDVAVIVDDRSTFALACSRTVMRPQAYVLRNRLYRLGAPIRVHYLGDLLSGKVPPCKAYVFLNLFHLDAGARAAIGKAIRDRTAVFFYGNGFLADDAADANIAELVGIPIRRTKAGAAMATFVESNDPLLAGLERTPFGSEASLDPLWTVKTDSADIRPLATLASGETLVAARTTPAGLRIYVGTTDVTAAFLRNVMKQSGVHLYLDSDDVISADDRFLAVTACTAGTKALTLRTPATVKDACSGQTVAESTRHFELPMTAGETRLFVLE